MKKFYGVISAGCLVAALAGGGQALAVTARPTAQHAPSAEANSQPPKQVAQRPDGVCNGADPCPPPTEPTNCPSGDFCAYTYSYWGGTEEKFTGNAENWNSSLQNNETSVYNNSSKYVRLYYGPDYGNPHTCIGPHESIYFDDMYFIQGIPYTFTYWFNSDSPAGVTDPVAGDVHGSSMDTTACDPGADMLDEYTGG